MFKTKNFPIVTDFSNQLSERGWKLQRHLNMSGFKVQSWNKSDGQVSESNPLCYQTLRLDTFFDVSVICYCE